MNIDAYRFRVSTTSPKHTNCIHQKPDLLPFKNTKCKTQQASDGYMIAKQVTDLQYAHAFKQRQKLNGFLALSNVCLSCRQMFASYGMQSQEQTSQNFSCFIPFTFRGGVDDNGKTKQNNQNTME